MLAKAPPQLIRTHKHTSLAAALFPEHQYCKLLHSCIICTDIARSGAACNSVPPPSLYLARLVCVCALLPPTAASYSSSFSSSSFFSYSYSYIFSSLCKSALLLSLHCWTYFPFPTFCNTASYDANTLKCMFTITLHDRLRNTA